MTAPLERSIVVAARFWHRPAITVALSAEGIRLTMGFDDVVQALAREVGNPALLLTEAQLLTRLRAAAAIVVEGMKERSSVMPPDVDVAPPLV